MILDSTFVIDLLKNNEDAVTLSKSIEEVPVCTTAITVFEVIKGARDSEQAVVRNFFAQQTVLSVDAASAERAGLLHKHLKSAGITIDPEDCLIAGIALTHKKKIVTRNAKHFSSIPGLEVVSY